MYSYTCILHVMILFYSVRYLNKTKSNNKNIIMTIKNIINLKYLFCFFLLSTKLTYSSSKFVLMFILYVFSYNLLQNRR